MDRVTVKPFAESCENVLQNIFQKANTILAQNADHYLNYQKLARWEPSKDIRNAGGKLKTP